MSNSIDRGLRGGNLPMLKSVLEEWQLLNERIGAQWKSEIDAPWWYNERASLSIFAGAIWKSGGWVMEEFAAPKTTQDGRGNRIKFTGRCDIRFSVQGHKFMAEAKQDWLNLGGNILNIQKTIRTRLDEACGDCKRGPRWNLKRLGIILISPRLHYSKQPEIKDYLQQFVDESEKVRGITLAWTFPRCARHLTSENGYIYPGAVVCIRCI